MSFRRTQPTDLTIWFDGQAVPARTGESIAAALLAAGIIVTRRSAVTGAPRGPYCMMGVCFDCLAIVDVRAATQTCMTEVKDGMQVTSQHGATALPVATYPAR